MAGVGNVHIMFSSLIPKNTMLLKRNGLAVSTAKSVLQKHSTVCEPKAKGILYHLAIFQSLYPYLLPWHAALQRSHSLCQHHQSCMAQPVSTPISHQNVTLLDQQKTPQEFTKRCHEKDAKFGFAPKPSIASSTS